MSVYLNFFKAVNTENSNKSNSQNPGVVGNNKNNNRQKFLMIISIFVLVVFISLAFDGVRLYELPGINLAFVSSFVIFYFVYFNLNFFKNLYIRFLQKFFAYNLCFIVSILIASYLDFNIFNIIFCDSNINVVKDTIETVANSSNESYDVQLPKEPTLFEGFDFNLNEIVPFFIHVFKLEPVSVNYSQTLLAEQHQMLALALFILSISAIFLFLSFVFNVIVFSFRDKFKSYFKNKYILSYLNLSFKFIVLDLSFLFMVLIYNFYYIVRIAHFLVTHPIYPS